jgi:plasmid maintenance system antidote protein VapI
MGAYSTQIAGHYRTLDNLGRSMANYQRTVGAAAYVELERYAEGIQFDYRQTFYTPFRDAVRTIESMEASIDELAEAREIINRACDLVKDSEIEKRVLGRIEVPYAMAYLNAMGQEEMARKIDEAVQTISNLQINTENDITHMYDVIDRLEKVFVLNFSENSLERNQYVQEAEQLNKAFVQELKLRLGDKAMEKEDLFYEQSELTQNWDDC